MNISDSEFQRLHDFMRHTYGVNLEKKRSLIEGRLSNMLTQNNYTNFGEYINDVMSDKTGELVGQLVEKLTTNYTYFMREEAHYNFMTNAFLPEWVSKIKDNDIRIWSAGCSSGEEPFTIAMVLDEYFGYNKSHWDTTVLATDISTKVLREAKKGIFPASHLDKLPPSWKSKYFMPAGPDKVKIVDSIAKEVVFSRFNLMDDFKFKKKFHLIFCRNVMIYFDKPTKENLTRKFYDILEMGGYLFIGLSESFPGIYSNFEQVSPAIYRKGPAK